MALNGFFEAIRITFDTKDPNSNLNQAEAILARADALHKSGYQKIGITYSANLAQSDGIHQANKNNQWYPIQGANQADVMTNVGRLLRGKYSHLQNVFRVLPITTCEIKNGSYLSVSDQVLQRDLDAITDFAQTGGVVLGWQNQNSSTSQPFAVGGGIFKLLPQQSAKIQSHLIAMQQTYPAPT